MPDIKKIAEQVETLVTKGVSTSNLNQAAGATTLAIRQDLSDTITDLTTRQTPFRAMVRREKGQGNAYTYNLYNALYANNENPNPRETIYADGGLPSEKTTQFKSVSVPYIPIGYQGSVTGFAEAQGASLIDLYASEVQKTTERVLQAEEWLAFWSDTTTTNGAGLTGFAGLDSLITTNVVDAAGAQISKALLDQAAELVAQRGGMITDIFTSIRVGININNLFNTYAQVIINGNDRQALTLGNKVRDVSTVAGTAAIHPDFFINPGNTYPLSNGTSSTPHGATTSTVFLLAMPYIHMRDLKAIGMEELGRVADKRSFFVNEYSTLALEAEPWCAKIINVADAIAS